MTYIVAGLSIFVFIQTLKYGIYEKKQNNNNIGSIIICILSIICLILPNVIMKIVL